MLHDRTQDPYKTGSSTIFRGPGVGFGFGPMKRTTSPLRLRDTIPRGTIIPVAERAAIEPPPPRRVKWLPRTEGPMTAPHVGHLSLQDGPSTSGTLPLAAPAVMDASVAPLCSRVSLPV